MQIKSTPGFDKKAKKIFSEAALEDLLDYLETNPAAGDMIRGTGGVRKLRWKTGKNNKGKSGGVRVLYHYTQDILVLLVTLYEKSQQEDISEKDKNELKALIPELVAKYREGE